MNTSLSNPKDPRSSASGGRSAMDPTFFLPKVELSRFAGAVRRWGWLPVLLAILAGVAAWFVVGRMTKYYASHGSVYVSTEAPRVSEIQASTGEESKDLEQMQSVEQGMLSNMLLMRVADKLGLADDPTFAPKATSGQQVLEVFAKRLDVTLRRGTRIIDITVEDTDPERASRIVEAVKVEYEALSGERQEKILGEMVEGLTAEEKRLRDRMEQSLAAVQGFRDEHPVPGLEGGPGTGTARDELSYLNTRLTEAKTERLKLEAEREQFARFDPENPDALAGLPRGGAVEDVASLVRQVREKDLDFARIKERYLHKHPEYQRAQRELEEVKKGLAAAMATAGEAIDKSYRIAAENERKLEAEVAAAKTGAVEVDGLRARFSELVRAADADRTLYEQVSKQLRETSLAGSVPASVLSWRDLPTAPERSHRPRRILLAPLASALAFGLGLFIAAGLELTDRRIRGAAGVMRATGAPMLGQLPASERNGAMVMLSNPNSPLADAFRRLRVVLTPKAREGSVQTLLFTSAKPGEGSSFCAVNHAVSLAMEGHRTLLVDADLRSPGLSRQYLSERAGHLGLGGYLEGQASAAEACVRTSVPKLYLISSGEMKPEASELLSRTRFPALLEEAGSWFDRVVIDAPAVLSASDAQIVARSADRTCLVVGRGSSNRDELREASAQLRAAGANLVGFVWNEQTQNGGEAPSLPVVREAIGDGPGASLNLTEHKPG